MDNRLLFLLYRNEHKVSYDLQTKNHSALKLSLIYKKMGVNNYALPLLTLDPELLGRDPWGVEVMNSQELMARVAIEVKDNYFYFVREVQRTLKPGDNKHSSIKWDRFNFGLWFNMLVSGLTIWSLLPRQYGKSFANNVMSNYRLSLTSTNEKIFGLSKDNALKVSQIEDMKKLMSGLPPYLSLRDVRIDTNNQEKLTVKALGNVLNIAVPPHSEAQAYNVGRGHTFTTTYIEEIGFIKYIEIIMSSMMPATNMARHFADMRGDTYYTNFITTPADLSTKHGKYVHGLYQSSTRFTEKMLDAIDRDAYIDIITKNNRAGAKRVIVEFNHLQLGFTDEDMKNAIEASNITDKTRIAREFLLIWTAGGDATLIDKKYIGLLKTGIKPPMKDVISPDGFMLNLYKDITKLEAGSKIVIGIDTSEALGKDGIEFIGLDSTTGELAISASINEVNTHLVGKFIFWILTTFKDTVFIIEAKSTGVGIIDHVLILCEENGINPFTRLFNWVVQDSEQGLLPRVMSSWRENLKQDRNKFGYKTTGSGKQSRKSLYGGLKPMVQTIGGTLRYNNLVNDILKLKVKNGRIDHDKDGNDDTVIAALLSHWLLTNGKNLHEYGISLAKLLTGVVNEIIEIDGFKDKQEYIRIREEQKKIKKAFEILTESLKKVDNKRDAYIIYNKIKRVAELVDDRFITINNIEQLKHNNKFLNKAK